MLSLAVFGFGIMPSRFPPTARRRQRRKELAADVQGFLKKEK